MQADGNAPTYNRDDHSQSCSNGIHHFPSCGLTDRIGQQKNICNKSQCFFIFRVSNSKFFMNEGPHDIDSTAINVIYDRSKTYQSNDPPAQPFNFHIVVSFPFAFWETKSSLMGLKI